MANLGEMLTLDEHNQQQRLQRQYVDAMLNRAGVLCPSCRTEMLLTDSMILARNPPKRNVHCPACGQRGYKE